ncbi:hypothetical protein [Sphingomonas sp. TREG-RG-20F-R18-01]|uniref:hypothetical protein n=1 Tax=Sphingomonas sp. TREG-RG-20F-R18-01 TaxID=2914982 RepID=UPI001F57F7AA|nr:hypothetical protein [Sphingomonas sp. TREG-RG-20F-R18-01]
MPRIFCGNRWQDIGVSCEEYRTPSVESRATGQGECRLDLPIAKVAISHSRGGNSAAKMRGAPMMVADLCLILGVLLAFATLVLKIIEMARKD